MQHGNAFTGSGRPDLIVGAGGVYVAIELKKLDGSYSPAQLRRIRKIRETNNIAFGARTVDEVLLGCRLAQQRRFPHMAAQDSIELDLASLLGPINEAPTQTVATTAPVTPPILADTPHTHTPQTHEHVNGGAGTTVTFPAIESVEKASHRPMVVPPTGGGVFERLLGAVERIERMTWEIHQMLAGKGHAELPPEVDYPIPQDSQPTYNPAAPVSQEQAAANVVIKRRNRRTKAQMEADAAAAAFPAATVVQSSEGNINFDAPLPTSAPAVAETPPAAAQPAAQQTLDDLLAGFDL